MTGNTEIKKSQKIIFDIFSYGKQSGKQLLLGSFSIDEDKLDDISSLSICKYLKDHYTEYFYSEKVPDVYDYFNKLKVGMIEVDNRYYTVGNIRKL